MRDLASMVPPIQRATGYRLYDRGGRRYLDLCLSGAVAILGHRHQRLGRTLKSTLDRGLLFDLPSIYRARLETALARRLPDFPHVYLFRSRAEAGVALARYLECRPDELEIWDPGRGESGPAVLDRPLLPPGERRAALSRARAVIPVLPFAAGGFCALCLQSPLADGNAGWLSPVLLAGILRSLADLERFEPPPWYRTDFLGGADGWAQIGPYVRPLFDVAEYPRVFERFLAGGAVLSPRWEVPSVLPGEASAGEMARLKRLFRGAGE